MEKDLLKLFKEQLIESMSSKNAYEEGLILYEAWAELHELIVNLEEDLMDRRVIIRQQWQAAIASIIKSKRWPDVKEEDFLYTENEGSYDFILRMTIAGVELKVTMQEDAYEGNDDFIEDFTMYLQISNWDDEYEYDELNCLHPLIEKHFDRMNQMVPVLEADDDNYAVCSVPYMDGLKTYIALIDMMEQLKAEIEHG